ncbi:response regulator transcription factor [Fluviicola sp.]|uniref:response regulator transcription factor n=1 Tax=Fluviicola sp. TaxID=1917219 RepID=UPI0031CE10CA
MNASLPVIIVDDDQLIVELLADFIELQPDMHIPFTASGKTELFEKLETSGLIPHLVLLDLKMKEHDGIDVAKSLIERYPDVKIIVLTSHYQASFTGFMVKLGVSAFLPKGISPKDLVAIIREVDQKNYYFKPEQIQHLRSQISSKSPAPVIETAESLTLRELEVLRLLCFQKTAKEIGEELFITPRTVEGHKNNLFIKTGQKNLAGLVIYAIQRSVISIDELPVL